MKCTSRRCVCCSHPVALLVPASTAVRARTIVRARILSHVTWLQAIIKKPSCQRTQRNKQIGATAFGARPGRCKTCLISPRPAFRQPVWRDEPTEANKRKFHYSLAKRTTAWRLARRGFSQLQTTKRVARSHLQQPTMAPIPTSSPTVLDDTTNLPAFLQGNLLQLAILYGSTVGGWLVVFSFIVCCSARKTKTSAKRVAVNSEVRIIRKLIFSTRILLLLAAITKTPLL
jgi:hypothetical protein